MIAEQAAAWIRNPGSLNYTQGPLRWEGINKNLRYTQGKVPTHGDCSSTHTYLLWVALTHFDVDRDIVNGQNWRAGYTGTILNHGKPVVHLNNVKVGDAIVYGRPGSTGAHVVTSLGGRKAFSHGSQGGPYLVDIHYRGDIIAVRRSI